MVHIISFALCFLGIFDSNGTHISLAVCFLRIFDWYTYKFLLYAFWEYLNGTHISLALYFLRIFEWYTY